MQPTPVIAIFDVGKTNKKLFLFDEQYQIVHEENIQLPETGDEDGFPCEDLKQLSKWVEERYRKLLKLKKYAVRAINFSAYGASFVHIGDSYEPVTPLYNYLKPFPEDLKTRFYESYGGEEAFSLQTASPALGMLNSGLQLYWLKYHKPELFRRIEYSLHLPQYLSYLITGGRYVDITSLGCHTGLWDFQRNDYHRWVYREEMHLKFAPVYKGSDALILDNGTRPLSVGVGLHDSSAALIPYLASFHEPFVLISTGTWCITLNPFNPAPLTAEELKKDCLAYMSFQGQPVKASRLFAGNEHEEQTKRLAGHFNVANDFYKGIAYSGEIIQRLQGTTSDHEEQQRINEFKGGTEPSAFRFRELAAFSSCEEAYHQLIKDIMVQQVASTQLVLRNSPVKRIFVDGGFGKNAVYMNLLSSAFPDVEVFAASMAQASSLGAALAIHEHWNGQPLRSDLIDLRYYADKYSVEI